MSSVAPLASRAVLGGRERFWRGPRLRALYHGAWLAAVVSIAVSVFLMAKWSIGVDARAYFSAWTHHLYSVAPEQRGAYLYSPVFAQAIWPLTLLGWPAFCAIWLGTIAAIYAWLLAPLPLKWRVPLFLACSIDFTVGNVWSFFALVAVLGLAYPGAWAFPILTKVTPVVGPVWFIARREWRQLGIVCAAVIGLAGVSFAFDPGLWHEWFKLLLHPGSLSSARRSSLQPVFFPRTSLLLITELPIAFGITVYAARTDKSWLIPVAMIFANPLFTANAFVMLAAIPRLRRSAERQRAAVARL